MKKIKILELYILKKLIFTFIAAEIVYSLIFFIQNLFLLSSLIVEKNAPSYESFLLVLYMLPKTIVSTIPFSVIFASLFVTFQLASTSELIAINSSGIGLKKQKFPYLTFAFAISLIYAFLVFHVVPMSKKNRDNIINKINIRAIVYSLNAGEFNKISDTFYLYANKVQKNVFKNVTAFKYKDFDNFEIIFSKKAKLNLDMANLSLSLIFFDGKTYSFASVKSEKISESNFGKKILSVSINPDFLKKKDTDKGKRDKFSLIKLFNYLKNKDKIVIAIIFKRLAMILFIFLSPLLGFYLGFSLKRGAVISGAIVYGFTISFFYIILLNIFTSLMQHNILLGGILIFILLFFLLYFLFVNKERIEKPLVVKERRSFIDSVKGKTRKIQHFFEKNLLKKIEEKELVSLKFPLLLRYVVLNFLKTFLIFFILLQSIYLLTITLKIIVNLFKYKGNILTAIKYIAFSTLSVYPLILPFSFLMASLFYFMMLEDKNEITAIKSCGISLYTVIMPLGYIAFFLSILLLFFTTLFSPLATKKSSLLYIDLNKKKKSVYLYKLKLKNRSVIKSFNNKNGLYWCDYYDFEKNDFINFISMDFNFSQGILNKIYKAKKLHFKGNSITKRIGEILIFKDVSGNYIYSKEIKKPMLWDNLSFFKEIEPKPEEMTQFELREFISRKKAMGVRPYKYITDYYYRFASAFSPLVLLLFGLPLAFAGEGRKKKPITGIGVSLVLVIIYYALTSLALSFGARHYLPSFFAAWFTNLLFSLSGLYLFTKIKT